MKAGSVVYCCTLFLKIYFIIIFMISVCISLCEHLHVGAHGGQKKARILWGWSYVVVNHPVCVLEPELLSSTKTASA